MTWFKVDDRFHSHPKVLATSLAALGLWSVAGSWSSDHRQGGFVPDHAIPLLARGASELVDELVSAGLWKRTRGGYQFHDWEAMNPTKEEAIAQHVNKSSGGSLGNHRRWHVAKGVTKPDCPFCQHQPPSPTDRLSDRSSDGGSDRLANRPDPTRPDDVPLHLAEESFEPPSKRNARARPNGRSPQPVDGPWSSVDDSERTPEPIDIAGHLAERAARASLREALEGGTA